MRLSKWEQGKAALWEARFYRRAAGRITKRDARRLARDFVRNRLFSGQDVVADRGPIVEQWQQWHYAKRVRAGAPLRKMGIVERFFFYGPRYGEWPGEPPMHYWADEGRVRSCRADLVA